MKMNKMLPVIVVVLVVGAAVFYFLSKGNGSTPQQAGSGETLVEKFTGTLEEAIAKGVGMKCSYEVDGVAYEGYVKGKNYSGQVKTAEGQVGKVIIKDDCVWSWTENMAQGVKVCYQDEDAEIDSDGDVWSQEDVIDASIVYDCHAAAIPDSEFTPPANVDFVDVDTMLQQYF